MNLKKFYFSLLFVFFAFSINAEELKNNTFTVAEDGANRIITGTVLVNKVGSKNSELLIDLDELITEA